MTWKIQIHRNALGLTALAACVLAVGSSQPAGAALKLYAGFNTTANAELGGQGSGSGWGTHNWSTTESTEGTNFFKTLGGAASFIAGDYGSLDINFRSIQRGGRGGKAEANRLWNTNTVRATGNEVWFSLLTKYFTSGGNAALAMTSTHFDPTQSTAKLVDSIDTDLGLGLRFAAGSEIRLSAWKNGVVDASSVGSLPATPGETMLLVGRINWNGSGVEDEITLWKVPAVGGDLGTLPSISLARNMNNNILNRIAIFDNERTIFDEIRFSVVEGVETSQDGLNAVVPGMAVTVPEPATLALTGLGCLLMIRRRP